MIGNEGKGFLAAHWDWLLAGAGAAALAAGAAWMVVSLGESPDDARVDERRSLDAARSSAKAISDVDMGLYGAAMKLLESPAQVVDPAETQGSFLASGKRVFCEQGDPADTKKACGLPISFGEKTCPFCGVKQPVEQKVALDSDGDGIPDDVEVAIGLNPHDASDAAGDIDEDGFTNAEELAAKTDPKDRSSHPDYLESLRIDGPLKSTKLPFVFERTLRAPAGMKYFFKDPTKVVKSATMSQVGVVYVVFEGEEIGDTGYVAGAYESRTRKEKSKNSSMLYDVDASVITVKRKSDGKEIKLVIGDKQHADADVQAKLVFERGGTKEFVVVQGSEIDLYGEKFTVGEICREGGKAKVTVVGASSRKTLEALEQ